MRYKLVESAGDTEEESQASIEAIDVGMPGDKYIAYVEVGGMPQDSARRILLEYKKALANFLGHDRFIVLPMYNSLPQMRLLRLDFDDSQAKFERLERQSVRLAEAALEIKNKL